MTLWLQYSGKNAQLFVGINWPEMVMGGYFNKSYVTYTIGRFFEMLPYAVLGILICHFKLLEILKKHNNYVILASLCCLHFFFMFGRYFRSPPGYGNSGINRIVIAAVMVILFYVLPLHKLPGIIKNIIVEISKHTMAVYFMHRIIGFVIYNSGLKLYFSMKSGSMHDCIIIFSISLFVSWLLSKIPIKFINVSMS